MSARREVMWRRVMDDLSCELAWIGQGPSGPELTGTVLVAEKGTPLRVDYHLICDDAWQTRSVELTQTYAGERATLRLDHDGRGRWWLNGREAQTLIGCTDVDLGVSPSTNALPVNRLRLKLHASETIRAAWVRFPRIEVVPIEQSYERIAEARYRYRSLASGFEATVEVDGDGLPIDYSGVWRRVADGPAAPSLNPETGGVNDGFLGALLAIGPASELGRVADDFAWLVGGWAADVRDLDADGQVREGRGEWWFAWVLEGRAIQDVWISPPRSERSRPHGASAANDRYGTTIRRFDREADLWRITWINPVSGATNHLAGRREADRIVLFGEEDGKRVRWSFNDITIDTFLWVGERQDGSGEWTTEAEFRLRRMG